MTRTHSRLTSDAGLRTFLPGATVVLRLECDVSLLACLVRRCREILRQQLDRGIGIDPKCCAKLLAVHHMYTNGREATRTAR